MESFWDTGDCTAGWIASRGLVNDYDVHHLSMCNSEFLHECLDGELSWVSKRSCDLLVEINYVYSSMYFGGGGLQIHTL